MCVCGGDQPEAVWVTRHPRATLRLCHLRHFLVRGERSNTVSYTVLETHRVPTTGRAKGGSQLPVHKTQSSFLYYWSLITVLFSKRTYFCHPARVRRCATLADSLISMNSANHHKRLGVSHLPVSQEAKLSLGASGLTPRQGQPTRVQVLRCLTPHPTLPGLHTSLLLL